MTTTKNAPRPEEYDNRADYAVAHIRHSGIRLDSKAGRAGFFQECDRWDAWNESRPERKAARRMVEAFLFWLP